MICGKFKITRTRLNSLLYNADHEVKEEHIEYLNNHYRPYNDLLNDFVERNILNEFNLSMLCHNGEMDMKKSLMLAGVW